MSGSEPWPLEIRVHADRTSARVAFDDGCAFELPARLLRAMTPSAAERGHGGPSFEPLATAPRDVSIHSVAPVGRYAVRIGFSDGHDSGLYDWARLHRIGRERESLERALGG